MEISALLSELQKAFYQKKYSLASRCRRKSRLLLDLQKSRHRHSQGYSGWANLLIDKKEQKVANNAW